MEYYSFEFVVTAEAMMSLNKCIGGTSSASTKQTIRQARLHGYDGTPPLRQLYFRKLFTGFKIREFHYSGNISNADFVFVNTMIDEHNVDHLNLRLLGTIYSSIPVSALLGFSSRVRSLYFT
ncbi:hypothetical protein PMAYCL1PPCAC_20522, partial [Pristionchus mayeri]